MSHPSTKSIEYRRWKTNVTSEMGKIVNLDKALTVRNIPRGIAIPILVARLVPILWNIGWDIRFAPTKDLIRAIQGWCHDTFDHYAAEEDGEELAAALKKMDAVFEEALRAA